MGLNATLPPVTRDERALIPLLQQGLPLVPRPYAAVGVQLGMDEQDVIEGVGSLIERGIIKRLGVVVRHRPLGYDANAMVVWDIPDDRVRETGLHLGRFPFVTLCYRRPRRLPAWPYNLFTMIHGRDRAEVLAWVEELIARCDLRDIPHEVLFSRRCFKQRGARYDHAAAPEAER